MFSGFHFSQFQEQEKTTKKENNRTFGGGHNFFPQFLIGCVQGECHRYARQLLI